MNNKQIKMEILITRREGMIAENKMREFLGQQMAYCEDNFILLAIEIESLLEDSDE